MKSSAPAQNFNCCLHVLVNHRKQLHLHSHAHTQRVRRGQPLVLLSPSSCPGKKHARVCQNHGPEPRAWVRHFNRDGLDGRHRASGPEPGPCSEWPSLSLACVVSLLFSLLSTSLADATAVSCHPAMGVPKRSRHTLRHFFLEQVMSSASNPAFEAAPSVGHSHTSKQ